MLVDSLLILLLCGLGVMAVPPAALAPMVWLAFTTPALVRHDVAVRRLPNALTLPALGIVVVTAVVGLCVETGAQDPEVALVAVAAVLVGGWAATRAGAVGLGDVKLAGSLVGSLVLVDGTALVLFAAVTSAAGVGAILLTTVRGRSRAVPARGVAYGPCLLLGYWASLAVEALT